MLYHCLPSNPYRLTPSLRSVVRPGDSAGSKIRSSLGPGACSLSRVFGPVDTVVIPPRVVTLEGCPIIEPGKSRNRPIRVQFLNPYLGPNAAPADKGPIFDTVRFNFWTRYLSNGHEKPASVGGPGRCPRLGVTLGIACAWGRCSAERPTPCRGSRRWSARSEHRAHSALPPGRDGCPGSW